jgi:hypothetical protein
VKVTLGSTGIHGNNGNLGGNIPNVAIFTDNGHLIGRTDGNAKKNWGDGTTNPVLIYPYKGMEGKQATYFAFSRGGNDAICISAISVGQISPKPKFD